METRPRLLRITTVPISLKLLLRGQFSFFQQHGFEVLTASADGTEVKDMVADGIAHQVIPMTRAITPFRDAVSLYKLIRLIQSFKPDIVHTHTPKAGLLGMMAAWFCRVPVRMHTVAGLPWMEASGVRRTVLKITERITYACATNVYPNSKGLFDFIMHEFQISDFRFSPFDIQNPKSEIRNLKFEIIGKGSSNGIDSTFFSRTPELEMRARDIRKQYHIPADAFVFCFVGRVVKDKGIVELVEAFTRMNHASNVWLLVVGPLERELDPLPDNILHVIHQDPHIVEAGFQQDVRPWMMASDAFVFPSYREGFPNVVMQAACLEVPCIVSDINGCNEIIQNNESGLIVPAKQVSALQEAMERLKDNDAQRNSFKHAARAFVTTHFDQQYVWHELLKEYRRLMATTEAKKNTEA